MELKDRVKWARKHAELTQVELASAVNLLTHREDHKEGSDKCSQVIISDIENGRIKRTGYLIHLAVACKVNPAWLQFGFEPREMTLVGAKEMAKDAERLNASLSRDDIAALKKLIATLN